MFLSCETDDLQRGRQYLLKVEGGGQMSQRAQSSKGLSAKRLKGHSQNILLCYIISIKGTFVKRALYPKTNLYLHHPPPPTLCSPVSMVLKCTAAIWYTTAVVMFEFSYERYGMVFPSSSHPAVLYLFPDLIITKSFILPSHPAPTIVCHRDLQATFR